MDVDSGIETMEVDDADTKYDVKRRRVNFTMDYQKSRKFFDC